eukprot:gene10040-264_t
MTTCASYAAVAGVGPPAGAERRRPWLCPAVLAFMDINPLSDGHCLVIPKYHCAQLHELPDQHAAHIGPALAKAAKALGAGAYNVLQNNGSAAHQIVMHVHFHIIPKPNPQDGLGCRWQRIIGGASLGVAAMAVPSARIL